MAAHIHRRILLTTLVLVAGFAFLALVTGRAAAAARPRPVSGQASFQLAPGPGCTSPLGICTAGTIAGDLRGEIAGTALTFSLPADASVPTVGSYVNRIVIRTTDGDVRCTEVGAANTGGAGDCAGLCAVTGGSGRFAGVPGYLLFRGAFSPSTGGAYRYEGQLNLP